MVVVSLFPVLFWSSALMCPVLFSISCPSFCAHLCPISSSALVFRVYVLSAAFVSLSVQFPVLFCSALLLCLPVSSPRSSFLAFTCFVLCFCIVLYFGLYLCNAFISWISPVLFFAFVCLKLFPLFGFHRHLFFSALFNKARFWFFVCLRVCLKMKSSILSCVATCLDSKFCVHIVTEKTSVGLLLKIPKLSVINVFSRTLNSRLLLGMDYCGGSIFTITGSEHFLHSCVTACCRTCAAYQ